MKPDKSKKLKLNKKTVAHLNKVELGSARGGTVKDIIIIDSDWCTWVEPNSCYCSQGKTGPPSCCICPQTPEC
jgi:hypothetical protein